MTPGTIEQQKGDKTDNLTLRNWKPLITDDYLQTFVNDWQPKPGMTDGENLKTRQGIS